MLVKKQCEKCKKKVRNIYRVGNDYICGQCKKKIFPFSYSLSQALLKVYEVRAIKKDDKRMGGKINVPGCLVGKKVFIALAKEDKKMEKADE